MSNSELPTIQHQQNFPLINYLKFYHFFVNSYYLVTCKMILQEDSSFVDHGPYDHEFFYEYPSDPSTRYHVTCNLLPHSLVENILNDGFCEMNFDVELLSLNQKFDLEQSLKQKLFCRMYSFYGDVGNHAMTTQNIAIVNGDLPSNDHITHQDTNGLEDTQSCFQ